MVSSKYNPNYHSSVVNNMRRLWQSKTTTQLLLNDEEVYNVFNHWYFNCNGEDDDATYFEGLEQANKEKGK